MKRRRTTKKLPRKIVLGNARLDGIADRMARTATDLEVIARSVITRETHISEQITLFHAAVDLMERKLDRMLIHLMPEQYHVLANRKSGGGL